MSNKAKVIWSILCIVCFIFGFFAIQDILKEIGSENYQGMRGFYAEPEKSLDAVFIGSSNVHTFWQPALGWADHGITVYSFSVDSLSIQSFPYMLIEAHKKQPQALYILNLSSLMDLKLTDVEIHRETNTMPFSLNKLKLIHYLSDAAGYRGLDQLQFYFPIMRFHSRWSELSSWNFTKSVSGYKHSYKSNVFVTKVTNQLENYYISYEEADLSPEQSQVIENLLDYCDEQHMNVLFISVPQALGKDDILSKQLNRVQKIIRERGYIYLDLHNAAKDIGIQSSVDYYSPGHTNVHGSIKFTEYLAQYLVDHYGFTDKRGMPGWESWDKAAELYANIINPYCLPFEREHAVRDYDLEAPVLNEAVVDGQTITLSWNATDGADAYDIYRKSNITGEKDWAYLDSVDAETLQITDSGLKAAKNYTYTVVPKEIWDGIEYYGNFDFTGVMGTTAK